MAEWCPLRRCRKADSIHGWKTRGFIDAAQAGSSSRGGRRTPAAKPLGNTSTAVLQRVGASHPMSVTPREFHRGGCAAVGKPADER